MFTPNQSPYSQSGIPLSMMLAMYGQGAGTQPMASASPTIPSLPNRPQGNMSSVAPIQQRPQQQQQQSPLSNPMQMMGAANSINKFLGPGASQPIGSASGMPLGSVNGAGGESFLPGAQDLTGFNGASAGGMDVGGGMGAGYNIGASPGASIGQMNFGGGLTAPGWDASGAGGQFFGGLGGNAALDPVLAGGGMDTIGAGGALDAFEAGGAMDLFGTGGLGLDALYGGLFAGGVDAAAAAGIGETVAELAPLILLA